ncbi:MAG: glycosyltransferase family 2 protein [Pseudomonadota bacterium]
MTEVSLAIPVYNSAPFLDGLFECLRGLARFPGEIVFLDDASSDDSLQRLRVFAEKSGLPVPVRVIANEYNAGIAGAYNRLVRETQGEWVQLLDGDDALVERDYYAQVMSALTVDNVLVITGLESNSALLRHGARWFSRLVPRHPPVWWPLLGSFATRSGVFYRRQSLIDHPFTDPMYPGSDVIHLLDLRRTGRCLFMSRPRVFHRVHEQSTSSRSRDYTAYRRQLARFGGGVRFVHGCDIALRQLAHRWSR